MTWVEHSLIAAGAHMASRAGKKPLSLSLLLMGSTVMMDLDHLWFRVAAKTVLQTHHDLALGFYLGSGTWTHSLVYVVLASATCAWLFEKRKDAFWAFFVAGVLHLAADWYARMMAFDAGVMWLWPFYWKAF